jgi:hypothetical protein
MNNVQKVKTILSIANFICIVCFSGCAWMLNGGLPPSRTMYIEGSLNPREFIIYNLDEKSYDIMENDCRDVNNVIRINGINNNGKNNSYTMKEIDNVSVNGNRVAFFKQNASFLLVNNIIKYKNKNIEGAAKLDYKSAFHVLSLVIFDSTIYCVPSTLVIGEPDEEKRIIYILEDEKINFFRENFDLIKEYQPKGFPIFLYTKATLQSKSADMSRVWRSDIMV